MAKGMQSEIDLNNKTLFAPLEEEMMAYYRWFQANPPSKIPKEVIYQGAGTEEQMPFMHLSTCAPAYVISGRYIREFQEKFGRAPRILEVGCGTGIGAYYLKTQVVPEVEVAAIDFSDEAIAYAYENYGQPGVKYIAEKAQELPFEDGEFDLVLSVQVLEHVEEGPKFVNEIGRVLKKGGVALVSTPNRELCQDLYLNNPDDNYNRRLIKSHEHEYYEDELRTLFQEASQDKKRLFGEVQINKQVNKDNRALWTFGLSQLKPGEGTLGEIRLKISNLLTRIVPLKTQNWVGRRGWEATMKAKRVSYEDLVLGNEYYQEKTAIKADSFFVVAKK